MVRVAVQMHLRWARPVARGGLCALAVSSGSGLASGLFGVHRFVRSLQQRVGIVTVVGVAGETDAGSDAQDGSFPENGLSNGCANLVHQVRERRLPARACEHNHELVSSETGDGVSLSH